MFWKFLDPGFLNRCRGECVKSFVRLFSYKQKMTISLLHFNTYMYSITNYCILMCVK